MSTTTIRIDEDLKARLASAAEKAGQSTHAFIVHAIVQTVEQVEADAASQSVADARWAKVLATGRTVHWAEAEAYLKARARGEKPVRPKASRIDRRS